MQDRIRLRAVLVAVLLAALVAAAAEPAVAAPAVALGGPSTSPASPVAQAVGGPQLAGRGVIVNYPSPSVPRLPSIQASAFVAADAGTGQVLAAKDPHGWYRPASTLKMLTAVALIPVLDPDATEISSAKQLLNWGFAADGLVASVGTLVGPLQPPSVSHPAAAPSPRAEVASGSHREPVASSSVLAAAGFSCAAVLAAALGFVYTRRQRLRASRASDRPDRASDGSGRSAGDRV